MSQNPRLTAGRFVLGYEIGGGAFGPMHLGRDTLTGEKVAIKLLRRQRG